VVEIFRYWNLRKLTLFRQHSFEVPVAADDEGEWVFCAVRLVRDPLLELAKNLRKILLMFDHVLGDSGQLRAEVGQFRVLERSNVAVKRRHYFEGVWRQPEARKFDDLLRFETFVSPTSRFKIEDEEMVVMLLLDRHLLGDRFSSEAPSLWG